MLESAQVAEHMHRGQKENTFLSHRSHCEFRCSASLPNQCHTILFSIFHISTLRISKWNVCTIYLLSPYDETLARMVGLFISSANFIRSRWNVWNIMKFIIPICLTEWLAIVEKIRKMRQKYAHQHQCGRNRRKQGDIIGERARIRSESVLTVRATVFIIATDFTFSLSPHLVSACSSVSINRWLNNCMATE